MPFTYSKVGLGDSIQDQLWGYQSANIRKDNIRYVLEDLFGDPASFDHRILFNMGKVRIDDTVSLEGDGTNRMAMDTENKKIEIGPDGTGLKFAADNALGMFSKVSGLSDREVIRFLLPTSIAPAYIDRGEDLGSSGTPLANAQYRDNMVKAWMNGLATPNDGSNLTITADFNIASTTFEAQGAWNFTFARELSSADWQGAALHGDAGGGSLRKAGFEVKATTSGRVRTNPVAGSYRVYMMILGRM